VILNLAVRVLPLVSVAEHVTRVRPIRNRVPDLGLHETGTAPSTSSRAATENLTRTRFTPRSARTVRLTAPVTVGGVTSNSRPRHVERRGGSELLPVWDIVAWLLAQSGRIAEARVTYERELDRLRDRGMVLDLMVGLARAALAERAGGDLRRAADHLRMAHALVRAEDVRGDLAAVAGELACVLVLQGEHAEAAPLTEEARTFLERGDVVSEVLWRWARALVAAHDGRHADAVRVRRRSRAC
jgi:hypothetical protein